MKIPKPAQPKPARKPMNGTSSIPHDGSRPNRIATSSGAQPYVAGAGAIHSASAVTSSSMSTGAARIAS